MRITAQNKQKTRERIRRAARKLFQNKGFDETTTRHIAAEAHIATGTLFNYFPTKESLAMAIVSESLEQAKHEFHDRRNGSEALDELLFDQVAVSLRYLRPHRGYVGGVLDRTWSPLAAVPDSGTEPDPRVQHLGNGTRTGFRLISGNRTAGDYVASILDTVSRRDRLLGRRRIATPGRHTCSARPVNEVVREFPFRSSRRHGGGYPWNLT